MPTFSQWLHLMLAEIARKRDDVERAEQEEVKRRTENLSPEVPDEPPPPAEQ
ncbi:MAG TPA: hypothetical protein VFO44_08910 [Steroidobacteraceae bacterium]|nr:hypothetical protein [Steroidobacteraceae bacterium]